MPDEPTPADAADPQADPGAAPEGDAKTADPVLAPSDGGAAVPDSGYTESGVPTLEGVRERIETRYGTALGATELAAETPEARTAAERYDERQRAAAERLAEIRRSMDGGTADSG